MTPATPTGDPGPGTRLLLALPVIRDSGLLKKQYPPTNIEICRSLLLPSFRSLALSTPNVMDTFNDIQIWIYQMIFKTRGRGGTGSPMQGSVLIQCIVDHS